MKILFSLLAFCLFASCVHSQEVVDTVSVRVQYRALYKHTHEQKEAYDDINLWFFCNLVEEDSFL